MTFTIYRSIIFFWSKYSGNKANVKFTQGVLASSFLSCNGPLALGETCLRVVESDFQLS